MPDTAELKAIKSIWQEENRLRIIDMPHYKIFETALRDISYLVNRLEAAEKAAKGFALMSGKYRMEEDRGRDHQ